MIVQSNTGLEKELVKEYINRLSMGKFITDTPDILEPGNIIREEVLCGTYSKKQLHIKADDVIKGVVYSSDCRVTIKNNTFMGKECIISYVVDARVLEDKEQIEGKFVIESNAAEKEITYVITGCTQKVDTSFGKGDDLFHFTNLVQKSVEEAAALYRSDNFKKIFLKADETLINLYDSLYDSDNVYVSMEEFLVAIKKKSPVTFNVNDKSRSYSLAEGSEKDSIILQKSGWGYIELEVSCPSDYVIMKRGRLTSEDFVGDVYELEYLIDYSRLHNGNNYTAIHIRSLDSEEIVELNIYKEKAVHTGQSGIAYNTIANELAEDSDFDMRMELKTARIALMQAYIAFRTKQISREQWISDTNKMLMRARGLKKTDIIFDVFQAGLDFISGNVSDGRLILENIKDRILTDVDNHVELYCLYLYVSTLEKKDILYTSDVAQIVSKYYENGYDTWKLLWILFYIDGQVENNRSIKLIRIKDTFKDGCTSPVMYIEALNIYNAQPELLRVMNRFEVQVISEGIKYNIITKKLARQVSYVIGNERNADSVNIELLKRLYAIYDDDEILEVLIVHMIRTGITQEEDFVYYEKAVLRGIRITRLYEFYIACIRKDITVRLPKIVLMYFSYDSGVNYSWKSFLFANIVYHKEQYKEIYTSYEQTIELYVYEQLKQGHIDKWLVYLYKEFLKPQLLKKDTAAFIAQLRFMYRITCYDDYVKAIIVKYGELNDAVVYEVTGRDTYLPIYTKECSIAFLCSDGCRRRNTINYEIEKIFSEPDDMSEYDSYDVDDKYITIYKTLYYRRKRIYKTNTLEMYKKALKIDGISDSYKRKLNSWMIEFYSGYYKGESFKEEYQALDTYNLGVMDSAVLIELLLDYGMYYEAKQLIERYGYAYVSADRLFKFMVHEIDASMNSEEYKTVITEYVFKKHLYNEQILIYMVDNYNGSSSDMYKLWKAAEGFGVSTKALSERIISQMLFTGTISDRLTEVFENYYKNAPVNTIVKAYTFYNSYNYIMKNIKAASIVFKVVEEAYRDKAGLPLACYVAWMKRAASQITELKNSDMLGMAQALLNELCEKELIYDYYRSFKGVLNIPYNGYGLTVIEYYGAPDKKVELNYRINDNKTYETVVMKCDACGIFTHRLVLFYDDKVNYYFTLQDGSRSQEYNLVYDDIGQNDTYARYDSINDCLASDELHDMVTLKKLMSSYVIEDYVTGELFTQLGNN